MPTTAVNSDEMYQTVESLGSLTHQLSTTLDQLGSLNNQASGFLAAWLSQSGRSALGLLENSRARSSDLTEKVGNLCLILAKAADGYVGADAFATEILARFGQDMPTGWQSNQGPTLDKTFSSWFDRSFADPGEKAGYAMTQSKNGLTQVLGLLSFKALFGAEKYLDVRAKKGMMQPGDAAPLTWALTTGMAAPVFSTFGCWGKIWGAVADPVASGLNNYLRNNGIVRNLDHSEVVKDAEVDKTLEDLVIPLTPAGFSHNNAILSRANDQMTAVMAGQGRVEKYQGVAVQIIKDAQGEETAIVYITGTDPKSYDGDGAPNGFLANMSEMDIDPNAPLSQGSASMQLVEQALEHAGVAAGTKLVLAGFSKGGATAANFANNKEVQSKYRVQLVVDEGGYADGLLGKTSVDTVRLYDEGDFVPTLAGDSAGSDKVTYVPIDVQGGTINPLSNHDAQKQATAAAQSVEANLAIAQLNYLAEGASKSGAAVMVAGSTQPRGKTKAEMLAYDVTTGLSALYDAVDVVQEAVPSHVKSGPADLPTRIPETPDLPALVSEENTAGEYFESAYQWTTGKEWDASKPEYNFSPEYLESTEKAYDYSIGTGQGLGLDISVDGGTWDFEPTYDGERLYQDLPDEMNWDQNMPEADKKGGESVSRSGHGSIESRDGAGASPFSKAEGVLVY